MPSQEEASLPVANEGIFTESEAHLRGFIDGDPLIQSLIKFGASREAIRIVAHLAVDQAIEQADVGYVEVEESSMYARMKRNLIKRRQRLSDG